MQNQSNKKDVKRSLITELRGRIKFGIKGQGIPKTIKINKIETDEVTIQNYQFIQILLNVKSNRVNQQVLRLLTKRGHAMKFKNNCKNTPYFKQDTIWTFFIKAYLKLGKRQVDIQRQTMRQYIRKYAGDFSDGIAPGNQKREKPLVNDLDVLQHQYSKMLRFIEDDQSQQIDQEYQFILEQAENLGLNDQLNSHKAGLNNTQGAETMLNGVTSPLIQQQIDNRAVMSIAGSKHDSFGNSRLIIQDQQDRKSLRRFKTVPIQRFCQDSDDSMRQDSWWLNPNYFQQPLHPNQDQNYFYQL